VRCIGHKGGKERTIDLVNEARSPLYNYFQQGERKASAYVFTSQRAKKRVSVEKLDGWRWTENGIHQWWQQLKARARLAEARFINNIDFHDLRTGRASPTGAWKRWPIIWGISPKAGCRPFKPQTGIRLGSRTVWQTFDEA